MIALTDRQGEVSALGRVGTGAKAPRVGMNYRSADGQTHAQTLGLGGIERLEEPLKSLRVQPRAATSLPQRFLAIAVGESTTPALTRVMIAPPG